MPVFSRQESCFFFLKINDLVWVGLGLRFPEGVTALTLFFTRTKSPQFVTTTQQGRSLVGPLNGGGVGHVKKGVRADGPLHLLLLLAGALLAVLLGRANPVEVEV